MLTIATIFFIIALIYSSVGFGGGSSYIAILILMNTSVGDTRFIALLCNIIVVAGSSYHFYRAGLINWKKILPLVLLSVPFSYLGGTIEIAGNNYKIIASIALILAAVLMLTDIRNESKVKDNTGSYILPFMGGTIGFLSGLIGIGGGIFLSPLLHIIRWEKAKVISATASIFILVNSIAGISGQLTLAPIIDYSMLAYLAMAVFIGGQIGNYINLKILEASKVKFITAILVGIVGLRILYVHIFI